ncbi:MAG: hypothetical protein ACYCXY_13515 [Acidimicrobiales bacterium]
MPADDPLDELFPIRRDATVSGRPGRLEIPRQYRRKRAPRRLRTPAVDRVPVADAGDWASTDEPTSTTLDPTADAQVDVAADPDRRADASVRPASRAIGTGVASAVLAVVLRVVLAATLGASYVHHLSDRGLALGALGVLVATVVLSRSGVATIVCLAVAVVLATLDVAAPVGVALVVTAIAAHRRVSSKRRRPALARSLRQRPVRPQERRHRTSAE